MSCLLKRLNHASRVVSEEPFLEGFLQIAHVLFLMERKNYIYDQALLSLARAQG